MGKVIQVNFGNDDNKSVIYAGEFTKEEIQLIEGYKGLEEFYKEVAKEVWYVENGELKVR